MGAKRPERTARRARARAARDLVRDREKLSALSPGGSQAHPITVDSTSVIEIRARSLPCAQCDGAYRISEHEAVAGLRRVAVRCEQCGIARTLWFRLGSHDSN